MPPSQRGKKLIYFLQRLDETEIIRFKSYLESPLFANSAQLSQLLDLCLGYLEHGALHLEQIHADLFPTVTWTHKREKYIQLRVAQLLDHLLDHKALETFQADRATRYRYRFLTGLAEDWSHYIPFLYSRAAAALPKESGATRYHGLLRLETAYNTYLSKSGAVGSDTHLDQVGDALDQHFLLQKLKYGAAAENVAVTGGELKEDPLLEMVLQYLDNTSGQQEDLLLAYQHALLMLRAQREEKETAPEHYQQLKEILSQETGISSVELLDLYTYALNFCTLRIYRGHSEYIEETKWHYEQLLNTGLLLEKGRLGATYYKNIVTIMCRFGQFDWAEQFVEDYQNKITADPEKLAYLYNRAVIQFHRGNYGETVKLLYHRIQDFKDILFGIGARIYLCRSLWEQKELDWLEQSLNAFRIYLKRSPFITDAERNIYLLYVKYFVKILMAHRSTPDRAQKKLAKIAEELQSSGEGSLFQWLRKVVAQLRA